MFGTASIPSRPTAKLVLAALGMCLMMACNLADEFGKRSFWSLAFHFGSLGFGVWLCFFGVFRASALHRLWGWGSLIAGLIICGVLLTAPWLGWEVVDTATSLETLCLYLGTLGMLLTGYLLAIDRDVAAYRRQLALRFPDKGHLNLKIDNLPDDPINPL